MLKGHARGIGKERLRVEARRALEVLNVMYDLEAVQGGSLAPKEGDPAFAMPLSSDGIWSEVREGEAGRPDCAVESGLSAWAGSLGVYE